MILNGQVMVFLNIPISEINDHSPNKVGSKIVKHN
jgi:hypothetical protein